MKTLPNIMRSNTPVEEHQTELGRVFVKREDLACPPPGPPFAKIRGLLPYLLSLREQGVTVVGYMDTSVSWAGWGISFICKQIGMEAVVFYPEYKDGELRHNQSIQFEKWKEMSAITIGMRSTQLSVMWFMARNKLRNMYKGEEFHMIPYGMTYPDAVKAVSDEFVNTFDRPYVDVDIAIPFPDAIVVSVGSGTMTAGILDGCERLGQNLPSEYFHPVIFGVMCAKKDVKKIEQSIYDKTQYDINSIFRPLTQLNIVDAGFEYYERNETPCPFPCNDFYDLKAWNWLIKSQLQKDFKNVLFWNIGA